MGAELQCGVAMSSAFQTGTQAITIIDEPILWELSDPNNDVTDPESYVPYVGANPECEGANQICVIEAPSDGEPTPRPDIAAVHLLMEDLGYFQEYHEARNQSKAVRYKN